MDLNSYAVFGMMRKRMTWLTDRQVVLAQNMANADTPSYKTQDLREQDFKRVLSRFGVGGKGAGAGLAAARTGASAGLPVKMQTTNPGHIAPLMPESRTKVAGAKAGAEKTPSGNDVSVEDQTSRITDTQMDYQMTTNLYRKHLSMLKSVLRR
jgi:flagellar basal-body rod protein FlgB